MIFFIPLPPDGVIQPHETDEKKKRQAYQSTIEAEDNFCGCPNPTSYIIFMIGVSPIRIERRK